MGRMSELAADWQEQQDDDLQLLAYLDAVNTIEATIGGYEGQRIRKALLDAIGYIEAPHNEFQYPLVPEGQNPF